MCLSRVHQGVNICSELGGTAKATFCQTNGLFCDNIFQITAPQTACGSDADCGSTASRKNGMLIPCCSFLKDHMPTYCVNTTTAKVDEYVTKSRTKGECKDTDCWKPGQSTTPAPAGTSSASSASSATPGMLCVEWCKLD